MSVSDCHDCPGDCICHKKSSKIIDKKKFVTCYLDFHREPKTGWCQSNHKEWSCHQALDGEKDDVNNGWLYRPRDYMKIGLISTNLNRIEIKTGPNSIKKLGILVHDFRHKWYQPTNINVLNKGATIERNIITITEDDREHLIITFDMY